VHYTAVLPVAALLEFIGYINRQDLVHHFGAWNYLFSLLSILVAPVILGARLKLLQRIVRVHVGFTLQR
jgi:uncharacterized membrane protein